MIARRPVLAMLAASATTFGQARRPRAAPAWRRLFDGRSLAGWTMFQQGAPAGDPHHVVAIEHGALHLLGPRYTGPDSATFGHLATASEHADYHLRLECRWGSRRFAPRDMQRRNSGVLYHLAPDRDRLFPDGIEFQVEETDVGDAITINTRALQGPLLGGTPLWPNWVPALPRDYPPAITAGGIARQWLRHAGQFERLDGWNTLDLFAFDDQAAHLVNGRIVNTLFGLQDRAGAPLRKGRIALEFEAAEVSFRNVMIRPLDAGEIARIRAGG
ncbi:MAG: DUF1080 domain-containing protein [Sphingomonadales bacterium]|nr:DUF1080 domain-containing protein [Sphingomonadales bacterium]